MGISKFMVLLIIFTLVFLFIDKEPMVKKEKQEVKPKVSFFDSTMYEITEQNVKQIVKSKQADIYDKTEKLIDATIVAKSDKNSYDTNIVSANSMIKVGDNVYLNDTVNLDLADGTNIKTEQLDYNLETKIAQNSVPFTAVRGTDTFKGNNLFLDSISEYIRAKQAKFRMKVETNE